MSSAYSITDATDLLSSLGVISLSEKLTRSHDVDSACSLLSSFTNMIFEDQEIQDIIKKKYAIKENTVFEFLSDVNASNILSFVDTMSPIEEDDMYSRINPSEFNDQITLIEKEIHVEDSDLLILICAQFSDNYEPFILACKFDGNLLFSYNNAYKLGSIIRYNLF